MADVEKIAAELRVAIRAFMAYRSSSDESKNALQLIDDLRSVKNLRLLLDELYRLREALKPFAREADEWSEYDDVEKLVEPWPGSPNSGLCVGDLRAAARALSTQVEERE